MKKETMAQKAICLIWVFVGAVICGLGIELVLTSGIGVDPLTMCEEGLGKSLGISTGTAALAVNLTVLTIGFILNRKTLGWGSLVCSFFIGPAVNFFDAMNFPVPKSFAGGVVMNLVGIAVVGLGIAIYMMPDYGVGGMEAIMMFLCDKLHKPYGIMRVVMDCTWGVLGYFLGGTLGVGTFLGAFGIGTALQFFFGGLSKLVEQR